MEGYIHMKNNGFTMLEVLVVVIIIGILAILAVPSTREPVERSRAKRAEFNLLTIYSAQKRYFLAKRLYFVCDNITDPDDRLTAINSNLSIKIDDPYFNYTINSTDPKTTYRAWATRTEGKCRDMSMNLTASNSNIFKDERCRAW